MVVELWAQRGRASTPLLTKEFALDTRVAKPPPGHHVNDERVSALFLIYRINEQRLRDAVSTNERSE